MSALVAHTKTFTLGQHTVTLSTGEIARQADGAVLVDVDGTTVLVTVVGNRKAQPGADFFPLRVDYQERMYAAGKIPGGFFRREGRPSENETLVSRLIDRPIRPLFPKEFLNEVQVIATVVSLNPDVDADIPALIGTSAALAISGIPFNGPVGASRVGYIDGQFVVNPSRSMMKNSLLDLVVAGTDTSVLMVESEASELSEQVMLEAVMFGHQQMQIAIENIRQLAREVGKPVWDWKAPAPDVALIDSVKSLMANEIAQAYQIREKQSRYARLDELKKQLVEKLAVDGGPDAGKLLAVFSDLEYNLVRGRILEGELRIDGRDTETVRPITIRTGVLSRTHGSALFTRGETQALVVATLGTGRDAQILDNLAGEVKEPFMLHYNFPPYSVGETGQVGSPKRREIGHGRLAKRGVQAILPTEDAFPYVIRVVSEITESNGSSSMASICGTSLALMDAGVPVKSPVAGIAMGLIKEGERFAVLTDILGDEDHLGDMDFKVAGTTRGVTALQMDIKIDGITREIMHVALEQARAGRIHILGIMNKAMSTPRTQMSEFAPRMIHFMINPEKIRDVIGKGGSTIKALTEAYGASIEISDEGRISIVASSAEAGDAARKQIEMLTMEMEVGCIYEGKVARIVDFGAFVTVGNKDGLVHISQISEERVENVADYLKVGDAVKVKVLEIDRQGRVRLSIKEVNNPSSEQSQDEGYSD